jgi:hypothetical protein
MNMLAIKGILLSCVATICFFLVWGVGFSDCFGDKSCNNQAYNFASLVTVLAFICGLLILLAGVVQLARHDPGKRLWVLILVILYVSIACWTWYVLAGRQYFENKRIKSIFNATLYRPSYLPSGFKQEGTYYDENDGRSGRGVDIQTNYIKGDKIPKSGSGYPLRLFLQQGDSSHTKAAKTLNECVEQAFECDVVSGKNVKKIYCLKGMEEFKCGALLNNTYVSISAYKENPISRDESIAVLDSLVPE